jgi:hypothetical protein
MKLLGPGRAIFLRFETIIIVYNCRFLVKIYNTLPFLFECWVREGFVGLIFIIINLYRDIFPVESAVFLFGEKNKLVFSGEPGAGLPIENTFFCIQSGTDGKGS